MRKDIVFTSPDGPIRGTLRVPAGEGHPALIVCHGAGEFKENYDGLCEYLESRGIASLAIDLYGHGDSAGTRHCIDIRRWVEEIRLACDFLGGIKGVDADRLAAFGLSSGGTAILEAAIVEPRLKTLIALDATVCTTFGPRGALAFGALTALGWLHLLFTGRQWRIPMWRWFGEGESIADPGIRALHAVDPRMREAWEAYPLPGGAPSFFVSTIRRVGRIRVPTLVLWGELDKVDSPESGRRLFAALRCEKELRIIAGNGHMGHLDANRRAVFEATADWVLGHL